MRGGRPARVMGGMVVLAMASGVAGSCSPSDSSTKGASGIGGSDPSTAPAPHDCGRPVGAAGIPPEVAAHRADWPVPGRDYGNTRSVLEGPIDSTSVKDLAEAWRLPLPGAGAYGNAATTPLVLGDTLYIQDLSSNVHAVDVASGRERWTHTYDLFQIGPNGVAVGYGLVVVAKGSKEVAALDAATGREVWARRLVRTGSEGIDIQPQIVDGKVLVATVPISVDGLFVAGDRGVLHALDVTTGRPVWSFDTVQGDLWGNPAVNSGGGAWYTPTVDLGRGRVVWGTANPAPFPGTEDFPNGTSRPGANLYTDSMVVTDLRTGKLCWYHQAVPHDLFDRDYTHTMLVDLPGEGGQVQVGTGKMGRVIGYDPDTGAVRWDTPVGVHRNDELTELSGPTEVYPGTFGGVLTPPSAAEGTVYVAVVNAPSTLKPDETNYIGSELGTRPGVVVAVDASDGSVRWETELAGDPLGGTVVVADLVLTATTDGTIHALNRADGSVVHTITAPGGINGWPAVVGDTLYWPVGSAQPPLLVAYRLP